MAHTLSAKKNLRKSARRRDCNKSVRSGVKSQVKKLLRAVEGGNAESAQEQLRATAKKLYRAAAKNVIHKNLAARKLSRLSRKVNAALGKTGGTPAPKSASENTA